MHALHTLQRQTNTDTTTLDIVLATSKEAVGWCDAVLRCACASDSTVIMLLGALVGKILTLYHSWYDARDTAPVDHSTADGRQDAVMTLVSSDSSSASRRSVDLTLAATPRSCDHGVNPDAAGETQHACSPPVNRSSPVRVTLGAYRLDSEDEGRLKVKLMLIELRKVDGLLGRFRERVGMVSVKYESRTHESLALSLAITLRATAERLQRTVSRSI